MSTLTIVWRKPERYGMEVAVVDIGPTRLQARGNAIGAEPLPYWLNYELSTGDGFVTSRLRVDCRGARWRRSLDLQRDDGGQWTCEATAEGDVDLPQPGGDPSAWAGALDCDLGLSPTTNTMPILRHRLHEGESAADFWMAWVAVPALSVHLSEQSYTFVRREQDGAIVRYRQREFTADLHVDSRGIVIDYPGLATLVATSAT